MVSALPDHFTGSNEGGGRADEVGLKVGEDNERHSLQSVAYVLALDALEVPYSGINLYRSRSQPHMDHLLPSSLRQVIKFSLRVL